MGVYAPSDNLKLHLTLRALQSNLPPIGGHMAEQKLRTLSYRRATWFSGAPSKSLREILKTALGKFSTVASTKIVRADDSVIKIVHRRAKADEPIYIHISLYTPGEGASTVPVADALEEVDLGVVAAPEGREFLDGDAMLLINGNDVIICTSNIHENTAVQYLRDLVASSKQGKDDHSFDLLKIANREIVGKLIKEGVKKITLDAHAFSESLRPTGDDNKSLFSSAKAGMTRLLNALVGQDADADEVSERAEVEAAITIRADLRRRDGAEVVAAESAERVLDLFDSGYEIETVSGIKITPDEIAVRRRLSFPSDGKTVKYRPVWTALAKFYNSLLADGVNVG